MSRRAVAVAEPGMKSFVEEDLEFLFPATWFVEKWDRPKGFFDCHGKSIHGTKAVDFIFRDDGGGLCLLEAKDYRRRRIENKEKMEGGLAVEAAAKVRDTLAVLFAAYRCGNRDDLVPFTKQLFGKQNTILEAVVLVAEDRSATRRNRQNLEKSLNDMLSGYRIRVKVLDGAKIPADAVWRVRNLPSSRSMDAPASAKGS